MQAIQFQSNHFRENLSHDEARELFRSSVRYVEIETFTYCNRKCWFCPNASMPERQDKAGQRMNRELYLRILYELASIDYRGQIQFGRYNEPFSDVFSFAWSVRQAREKLPLAYLYTHTNGDFLGRPELEEFHKLGLNEIKIQTYLGNDQRWDEQAMLDGQTRQLRRLGLRVSKTIASVPGFRHYHELDYPGMRVTLDSRNFEQIGTDRGGLVQIQQDRPRTAPCLIPFSNLYIDVTGDVMPCCNLRSDRPEHAAYSVCRLQDGKTCPHCKGTGDEPLTESGSDPCMTCGVCFDEVKGHSDGTVPNTIFDAFVALHGWRKSLMRFGPKSGPCATCRYDETEVSPDLEPELERIYKLVESVPVVDVGVVAVGDLTRITSKHAGA